MEGAEEEPAAGQEQSVEFVEVSAHILTNEDDGVNPEQPLDSSLTSFKAPAEGGEAEPPSEVLPTEGVSEPQENNIQSQEDALEDAGNPADVREPADELAEEAPAELQPEPSSPGDVEQEGEQEQQQALQENEGEPSLQVGEQQTDTPDIQDKQKDNPEARETFSAEKTAVVADRAPSLSELGLSELGFLSQIRAAIAELGGIGDLIEEHEEAIKRLRDRRAKLAALSKRLTALTQSDSSSPTSPSHGGSSAAGQPLPLAHAFRRSTVLAKGDEETKRSRLALRATTRQTLQKQSLRLHEPPQRTKTPTPPRRVEL
ncbi:hypothetical protein Emag_004781 [Eimeria magna]